MSLNRDDLKSEAGTNRDTVDVIEENFAILMKKIDNMSALSNLRIDEESNGS